ncbi:hypothetical protein ACVIIW_006248 [Bradyrhizobium sp. USDA 4449]
MPTFDPSKPYTPIDDWEAFPRASSYGASSDWEQFPRVDKKPEPISANNVVRSAATGVPVVGGVLNKLNAASNATLAPVLNPLFKDEDQLKGDWSQRYADSLAQQEGMDRKFEAEHPLVDTGAKIAGGVASMAPIAATAAGARAFGMVGKNLLSRGLAGGASGAGIATADALARGESPTAPAVIGGIVGAAAPGAGKLAGSAITGLRNLRQPLPAPANMVDIAGVPVRRSFGQLSGDLDTQMLEQGALRNTAGQREQQVAEDFFKGQNEELGKAREAIGAGFDPTGTSVRTDPQDAAERIAAELIAQEQGRQASQSGVHAGPMSPAQQGANMARFFGGGQVRAATPFDAGEALSDRLAAARDASKADYRAKYKTVSEQPGEFAPGSAAGFRNDVESGLAAGENPVSLDETNTPKALQALKIIDNKMNAAGPGRVEAAAELGPEHAQNVSDIREKFGDQVAAAYDRQKQAAAAPKAQSLLEFLASKGGLGPDAELEAIGAHGHTVNVEGAGRRKLVKQGGWPLDYAREAAEEAGYLRGDHNGTSTVNDLLDAIDAEMRGQKRYPEGFEGHVGKRESAAMSERERAEFDRHMQGLEDDLHAAGHGELGGDVKQRALKLMSNDGMDADTAVEHAFRQLEQEDNAVHSAGFPGDRPVAAAERLAAQVEKPGSGFTMRDVEQVRKQLSTLYGDARRAMLGGGSGSDLRALEHIIDHFDSRVEQMIEQGKFSGEGPAVLQMQREARASFADYKQKFTRRGSGDTVGAAVEKILGKFSDTKATPDEVVRLAYGSASAPGGQMPVQVAQRIAKIFGRDSAEFSTYKQGLFQQLTTGEPGKVAARIDEFLTGTKGKLLAQTAFDASERKSLARYAERLRSTSAPQEVEKGPAAAAIRRIVGADGAPPAAPNDIVNRLFGATGTGNGVAAVPLAQELKRSLSPEGWTTVRQGMWSKLTQAAEGRTEWGPQKESERIFEFLNGNGKALAQVMFSDSERNLIGEYGKLLKQLVPKPGAVNYSNTATHLAKMMRGAVDGLFAAGGLHLAGPAGLGAGMAGHGAQKAIADVVKASKVARALYGTPSGVAAEQRMRDAIERLTTLGIRGTTASAA